MRINASMLQHHYQQGTTQGDDPRLTGEPDHSLFNRHEQHEVLYLLNKFAERVGIQSIHEVHLAEAALRTLPSDRRSQAAAMDWLLQHWPR